MASLKHPQSPIPTPAITEELVTARAEVSRFAERMETKLRANDHKQHWSTCDLGYLLRELDKEVNELHGALAAGTDVEAVANEAADVANIAMMIADKVRRVGKGWSANG